ncbi:MAG: 2,3-bisphosphoglycerate-independent phosphoglycerate mutase [Candidatus Jorgensenbacteria bacterium]
MKRTFILAILDGWGLGEFNESNPIYKADLETIKELETKFPKGALQASGIAIGLPWEEEGNSEVGHLTLGAGKIIYQYFPKISMAIEDGSFFQVPELKNAFSHAKENISSVHLIGLLTQGNVHASFDHLAALIEMAAKEKMQNLYLHLFSDGRDSPPRSVLPLLKKLNEVIAKTGVGVIASVTGRYFGMDRNNLWERTEKAYQTITGENQTAANLEEAINKIYGRDLDDEYIEPTVIEPHPVKDNDTIIFFNFREDSMRQISEPFLNPDFNKFPIKPLKNTFVVTMTGYTDDQKTPAAFPKSKVENPLGKLLSDKGLTQLRIAETEKYAHITYFFNGLREAPYPNEFRVLVPSKTTIRHEENPEMMAKEVTDRAIIALREGGFDFILINYANPDLIAHTGNYEATLKAVKIVDQELGRLVKEVLEGNHVLVVTSDHGNAESVLNLQTGEPETFHDPNPVPIYLVAREFEKPFSIPDTSPRKMPVIGILSDVAPTLLELMKIPKPEEMTGESLLRQLTS